MNHPCILEGWLSTNPILSALHLESPRFDIYFCFSLVNKQFIGFHSRSEIESIQMNVNKACNKLGSKKNIKKSSLALRL